MPKSKATKRKTQGSPSAASYSTLKKRFDAQAEELREALEQQAATSEILRVIAARRRIYSTVLDTVAENAARLCEANDALIVRVDGNPCRSGLIRLPATQRRHPISRESVSGRAVIDRQTIHVHDIAVEVETTNFRI